MSNKAIFVAIDGRSEDGNQYASLAESKGAIAVVSDHPARLPSLKIPVIPVSNARSNAALAARLPILERHPHSKPVEYVQAGLDATTFTDKDLKFMNNTTSPIIIRSYVKNTQVIVDLWSL